MTQHQGQVQLNLSWGRCGEDGWCGLNTVDLDHNAFNTAGVYVIWYQGPDAAVVYIGQGDPIGGRLTSHREDPRIQRYKDRDLLVSWAAVDSARRNGVETGLATKYPPLVGERHPNVPGISANAPWE
jgi:hypothetical protein